MPSFSRGLERALHNAMTFARDRTHEMATLEHLLLSLIDDTDAIAVLDACDVDREILRRDLEDFLDEELNGLITDTDLDPTPTAAFQRVVQRAVIHVQSSGRDEVTGANVLVAIFAERESHAAYFLEQQDMTRLMQSIIFLMASAKLVLPKRALCAALNPKRRQPLVRRGRRPWMNSVST